MPTDHDHDACEEALTAVSKLHVTIDAAVWAKEFISVLGGPVTTSSGVYLDEGFMIGWFANAIETARAIGEKHGEQNVAGKLLRLAEDVRLIGGGP